MNNKKIYISSCHEDGGIYSYKLCDGVLTNEVFNPCPNPMYTIYEGGKLYVLLRNPFEVSNHSGIFTAAVDDNGKFCNVSETISTLGVEGCHLCTADEAVYAANYVCGSIVKLGEKLVTHEGKSTHPTRQEKAHCHYVCKSPEGKYILAVDLGMDAIVVYDKGLNEVSRVYAPKGNGPRHLIFSPVGKLCYCADELSSTVSVYRYKDGTLTYLDCYSALPKDFNEKNTIAAIREKDGYVYTSNRGHDSIAVFKAEDEKLSLVNIFSCQGKGPRDFDVVDNILISTNEGDGSVTVFDIGDIQNPVLKQKLNVKKALCITIV